MSISNEEVITNIQSKPFTLLENKSFTVFLQMATHDFDGKSSGAVAHFLECMRTRVAKNIEAEKGGGASSGIK